MYNPYSNRGSLYATVPGSGYFQQKAQEWAERAKSAYWVDFGWEEGATSPQFRLFVAECHRKAAICLEKAYGLRRNGY
jgi:hypothetical protein